MAASPATLAGSDEERLKERIRSDFEYWASRFAKIVTKPGELELFQMNEGQRALRAKIESRRAEGKPPRILVLKARQIGFSTLTQLGLLHRCTMRPHNNALTVSHKRPASAKLYRMANKAYANLPNDPFLKPRLGSYKTGHEMHFEGDGNSHEGGFFPDSYYTVETAGEADIARGGTYREVHGSEVAHWAEILENFTAIMAAVPEDPETLIVYETTANGYNEYKDWWDDAEEGRSEWDAFFWPWHKQLEYQLGFINDDARERFVVGDPNTRYAEEEPDLVRNLGLSLEQLHWRRRKIANDYGGKIEKFHQEYPSTPEEAFITTGGKVFDRYRIAQLLVRVDITDPRAPTLEHPGPTIGDLTPKATRMDPSRNGGTIEVPTEALWIPRQSGIVNASAPWRLWLEGEKEQPEKPSEYIVTADVSGGKTEQTDEPDYHAIEVIDHASGEQVAEYQSRVEPRLLAEQVILAALFFNQAYIVVERTGSWGYPVIEVLWLDYHYPHMYRSKKVGKMTESTEDRLGFDTTQRTKPLLVAGAEELVRIEEDGINSRVLANEARSYIRTEKGTTEAEPGRFDDCLMAWMIGQHVRRSLPMKGVALGAGGQGGFVASGRPPGGGLGAYDPRHR